MGEKKKKTWVPIGLLVFLTLAVGCFVAVRRPTGGQTGDKRVIRVAGWDMEYTVSDRKLTAEDFAGIELGSSLEEIEDRLGKPDGWVGAGILSPVYVLEDGSAVELIFDNDKTDEDLTAVYLYEGQKESVWKKR